MNQIYPPPLPTQIIVQNLMSPQSQDYIYNVPVPVQSDLFITPPILKERDKVPQVNHLDDIQFVLFYKEVYQTALRTGFVGTYEEFMTQMGQFLKEVMDGPELYVGQTIITPMVEVEQILRTGGKLVTDDIIVEQIPFRKTSNLADGYTAIIG